MIDPARQERIEAAMAAHYDIPERDGIVASLEAADAVEPRPVYPEPGTKLLRVLDEVLERLARDPELVHYVGAMKVDDGTWELVLQTPESRPVCLTAEERAALLRAAAEVFAATDPRLALSEEGQALNDARRKLKAAEEKS